MGEHEQEQQQPGDEAQQDGADDQQGQPQDDGGETPGTTGTEQAQPGDEAVDPVHPPEGAPDEEQTDRTEDGEEQTGADPQPE